MKYSHTSERHSPMTYPLLLHLTLLIALLLQPASSGLSTFSFQIASDPTTNNTSTPTQTISPSPSPSPSTLASTSASNSTTTATTILIINPQPLNQNAFATSGPVTQVVPATQALNQNAFATSGPVILTVQTPTSITPPVPSNSTLITLLPSILKAQPLKTQNIQPVPAISFLNGDFETDRLSSSVLEVGTVSYWSKAVQGLLQRGQSVNANWKSQVLSLYSQYSTVSTVVKAGSLSKSVSKSTLSNGEISKSVALSGQKVVLQFSYSGSEKLTGNASPTEAQAFARSSVLPQVKLVVTWNGQSHMVSPLAQDSIYAYSITLASIRGNNLLKLATTTTNANVKVVGTVTIDNVTMSNA